MLMIGKKLAGGQVLGVAGGETACPGRLGDATAVEVGTDATGVEVRGEEVLDAVDTVAPDPHDATTPLKKDTSFALTNEGSVFLLLKTQMKNYFSIPIILKAVWIFVSFVETIVWSLQLVKVKSFLGKEKPVGFGA